MKIEGTDLACSCFALVHLVPERYALVREPDLWPTQRDSMKLLEATALEVVADDGDARGVDAG